MTESLCSKCQNEPRTGGQRWGKRCHADYQKLWRKGAERRFLKRLLKIVARETRGAYAMSLDLVDMALTAEHEELIRRARAEPRAADAAAVKKLRQFVAKMLEQQVRGKR